MASFALGIVVNPKLKSPVLVTAAGSGIAISLMLVEEAYEGIGSGYYGLDDAIAQATGLPRSHTPSGVAIEGAGYGTCLYTALCLGAHQNFEHHEGHRNRFQIASYGPDGDGICSTSDDRSGDADEWWRRARRLGLAREIEDEQEDEDVDVTSDFDSLIEGQEYDGGTVSRVSTITADISKTVTGDVYLWSRAAEHRLIVADFTIPMTEKDHPSALWERIVVDKKLVTEVTPELILALDVRDLHVSAMNLLGLLAEHGGADEKALHDFRFRWEAGLDPSVPVTQIQLPFKKNSSESRRAGRALEEAAFYRREAGWSELEGLP